jgi:hypothetical protein
MARLDPRADIYIFGCAPTSVPSWRVGDVLFRHLETLAIFKSLFVHQQRHHPSVLYRSPAETSDVERYKIFPELPG